MRPGDSLGQWGGGLRVEKTTKFGGRRTVKTCVSVSGQCLGMAVGRRSSSAHGVSLPESLVSQQTMQQQLVLGPENTAEFPQLRVVRCGIISTPPRPPAVTQRRFRVSKRL